MTNGGSGVWAIEWEPVLASWAERQGMPPEDIPGFVKLADGVATRQADAMGIDIDLARVRTASLMLGEYGLPGPGYVEIAESAVDRIARLTSNGDPTVIEMALARLTILDQLEVIAEVPLDPTVPVRPIDRDDPPASDAPCGSA